MRSLLAAATAILALGAAAPAALAAPSVTLTHDPNLITNPTVDVTGADWGTTGFYMAQVAIVGDEVIVGSSQKWVRPGPPGSPNQVELLGDGTFSTSLDVAVEIGTAPDDADCGTEKCFIATWPQHTNPTPDSIFTKNRLFFAPGIEVDPDTDIAATGETIAVRGGGIPSSFVTGKGIIVSQIAVVGGLIKTPAPGSTGVSRYIRAAGTGPDHLSPSGTFDSDLTLKSTFESTSGEVNCGLVQCEIAVWEGQSFPANEGALLTRTDIAFAYNPSASVDPTTNLPETQQVTISGSGYNPGSPGVYVSQVAQVGDSIVTPPAGGGDTMQWLRPSGPTPAETLNPDGSFETSVTVSRTFQDTDGATVDCTQVQCSVITWRAHTNPSPSTLYTSTSLAFASVKSPEPDPVVRAPFAAKPVKKPARLSRKARKLTLGAVRCGDAVCRFAKPKWVRVRVGKRKAWLLVTGPKRAGANKPARFGVWMRGRVAKRLAGRKTRVRLNIRVRSDSGNTVLRINRLLVGPKRR